MRFMLRLDLNCVRSTNRDLPNIVHLKLLRNVKSIFQFAYYFNWFDTSKYLIKARERERASKEKGRKLHSQTISPSACKRTT